MIKTYLIWEFLNVRAVLTLSQIKWRETTFECFVMHYNFITKRFLYKFSCIMQMNTGTACIELRNFLPFAPSEAGNDSRRVSVGNTNTEGNIQFSTILFKSCSK